MDEARIDRATSRIQAALNRIDRAATRPAPGQDRNGEREARVRSALSQLDALIESLEK